MDELYIIYKNVLTLLINRGYKSVTCMDYETFSKLSKSKIIITTSKINDENDKIIVFFLEEDKLGIKNLKAYHDEMLANKIYHGILIIKESISITAKNVVNSMLTDEIPVYLEIFLENELIFDIVTHTLVPKHEKLSKEEEQILLKRYKIDKIQLPKIPLSDPVVKYYDFKKLDIIKITNISETAGIYINYRVVG